MKVLSNNLAECHNCGAALQYDDTDTHIGALGALYVTCPICGEEIITDEGIKLTKDSLRFPLHYWHFDSDNCAKVSDNDIDGIVRDLIENLEHDSESGFAYAQSCNYFVFVHRLDEDREYYIIVCRDHVYETWLPIEEE